MKIALRFLSIALLSFLVMSIAVPAQASDWQPITPEDLALKDNPKVPGSVAMILYRSIERDDKLGSEEEYVRIKIFKDEGKKYADVTIPPFDREFKVGGVSGRTIHPDGSIVEFHGQVFEKVVAKLRNEKVMTKSFTLPDVTPGSIIEYRYKLFWEAMDPNSHTYYYFPQSEWTIQKELYQRTAHFRFVPARDDMFAYQIGANLLPANAHIEQQKSNHTVLLDMDDIPAFEEEPYMPARNVAQIRVMFFYSTHNIPQGDQYWKEEGKSWYDGAEGFMNKKGGMSKEVAAVTSAGDSPEVKLKKIYDHVQTFENLTYSNEREAQEIKRMKQRENKNVEDVVNNKYGYRNQLNRTFVAMARAAGMEATLLKVTERDEDILHREWPAISQLRWEIAMVKLGGKTLYLDPGTPYLPFGAIPWEDSGVTALVGDKNMPTWIIIPVQENTGSSIERAAKMMLGDEGSLTGEITVTYSGEDAFHKRLWSRNEDDAARKKSLEEQLQNWLATKSEVELESVNDWKSSNLPLIVKYKVTIPGFASSTGHRVLIPATLFAQAYKNPFVATRRVNPVAMEYLYTRKDDVNISLPKNFSVENLPKAAETKNAVADISTAYANENGALHFTRNFALNGLFLETKYYGALRQYYQAIQSETNEQAVLKVAN